MCIDPIVLFFMCGIFIKLIFPSLKMPRLLYDIVSIFLLVSIGLKGGLELCTWASLSLLVQVLGILFLSVGICFLAYFLLDRFGSYSKADCVVVAAHYGSVSVGTFAVAIAMLQHLGIDYESFMPLFVALMEFPAIIIASLMLKNIYHGNESFMRSFFNALSCKSVYVLLLSIVFGYVFGPYGIDIIKPLLFDPFKWVLAIFLVEMGILVGDQFSLIKKHFKEIVLHSIGLSLMGASLGLLFGLILQLSLGGVILLMVLCASASYIAVPASLRQSYPQANVPLALSHSLGVTFPFNVFFGIYMYIAAASWVFNYFGLDKSVYFCS
jgi:hypothetical protein